MPACRSSSCGRMLRNNTRSHLRCGRAAEQKVAIAADNKEPKKEIVIQPRIKGECGEQLDNIDCRDMFAFQFTGHL